VALPALGTISAFFTKFVGSITPLIIRASPWKVKTVFGYGPEKLGKLKDVSSQFRCSIRN